MTEQALRYNTGKRQWSLVDFESLEGLVEVLEFGAEKYSIYSMEEETSVNGLEAKKDPKFPQGYKLSSSGENNWKKGLELQSILDSAQRHLIEMMKGEFVDKESKLLHAHHVICNMMFWVHFYKKSLHNI
jgi:hypothetical protein